MGSDLQTLYRQACNTRSDINEHLPFFVDLCQELAATKVIELGTRGGCSTVAWLYGLHCQGHLWSVDIDPAPPFDLDGWTFVQGDDLRLETVQQLPNDADIVFIDTSHAYQHTLSELNIYRWRVRPGGRMVLHDTEVCQPLGIGRQPPFPVKRAIERFCADEGLEWVNFPFNNGLGCIEIPEG